MSFTIYEISYIANGVTFYYVGCTGDYTNRVSAHLTALYAGTHTNRRLQWLYNRYGDGWLAIRPMETFDAAYIEDVCEHEAAAIQRYADKYGQLLLNRSYKSCPKSFATYRLPSRQRLAAHVEP